MSREGSGPSAVAGSSQPERPRPISLGYLREPPVLNPHITLWRMVAVVLFLLSGPLAVLLLWLLLRVNG